MSSSLSELSMQAEVQSCPVDTTTPSGLSRPGVMAPCVIVVFGASGDLAMRKLFPALFHLFVAGYLPAQFAIVGSSRTRFDDVGFRERIGQALSKNKDSDADSLGAFLQRISYHPLVYDESRDYQSLAEHLRGINATQGMEGNSLFYLAVPPQLSPAIASHLGASGLSSERSKSCGWSRIVLEKPFGHDLKSAMELDELLHRHFAEHQIFRIDHYLAKETVQNVLMFRFANAVFEPVWNRNFIDYVSIIAAESLGVENRAGYYEQAGVLRDMFQNHMMQLLSLVAMDPPARFEDEPVRDEKTKIFRSLRPFERKDDFKNLVLGQYIAGITEHGATPGYREEKRVAPQSLTPTFAMLRAYIDNWRWQGVPFYISSGKRLARKLTRIVIQFKAVPHAMFRNIVDEAISSNRLVLGIHPDEGINLSFQTKLPGMHSILRTVNMRFDYNQEGGSTIKDAYEKVLMDCLLGDQMLFWRHDAVKRCWAYLTPILELCESCENRQKHLHFYPAGSWGPEEIGRIYPNYLEDHA